MKDLMWASSALMIIVMDWDGLNMINPVHLFMQCALTDKNMLVLSRRTLLNVFSRMIKRSSTLMAMRTLLMNK